MDLNQVFSAFLNAFLPVVLPVLFAALAGLAVQYIRLLQAKIKAEYPDVFAQVEWIANAAVIAAEQAKVGELITDKKNYALQVAEAWLKQYNINVDMKVLDAAIEKAVYDVFNSEPVVTQ